MRCKVNEEELLKKAEQPTKEAMRLHPFYKGKIQIVPKCCIRDFNDFAIWYTPGVAQPCKEIASNPLKVFEYTNKANTVGIITDGSRVLGLGDIGPEASLPVMEGKAILYKYLGGVDAFPLPIATKDPEEFINIVKKVAPVFGGINLEDIAHPKCFYILERLRKEMDIPVWHDDQQGTATVVLAALYNALKLVGKKIDKVTLTLIGAGASNIHTAKLLITAGVPPENLIMVDSKGILHKDRADIAEQKEKYKDKWRFCQITNKHNRRGGIKEAMEGADVCIGLSTPGPDTIKADWVSSMNRDAILFACANPVPEIWPWKAKEAGAKIIGTGRSDFENQINNSLGFPGIFRGTLDVMAKTITDEMCIAAAKELAKVAEDKGLREDYIIPSMDEWEVFPREAVAVALTAIEQGIARYKFTKEELYKKAEKTIRHSRELLQCLMKNNFIPSPLTT
ncbi:MAG: NADP-dependent malic enzyme [Planctomycetota bacterium]